MPPVTKFKISACSPSHIISHRPRKCNPISEKYPSKITVIINRNLVADVVLLNKWLADNKSYNLTAQGALNADCFNPKAGKDITSADSDAIIKSIVHLVTLPVQG